MTTSPLFPGFDGLLTLSRREGVDIRPTLLRVLTDLYVRARLAVYPGTPAETLRKLGLRPAHPDRPVPLARAIPSPPPEPEPAPAKPPADAPLRFAPNLSMQPPDAAELSNMFFGANARERVSILHSLADT